MNDIILSTSCRFINLHRYVLIELFFYSFYRCAFDPVKGGEMVEQERKKFFVLDERVFSTC